tara:strand:- start:1994 stop:2134 length:141 start_codon:yes stop_codon:yes gene_type:complete
VAKELGYTLAKLNKELTYEELLIWSVYFDLLNDEHEEDMKKVKRRR